MNAIPHGTMNGYNNYRCRCDECRHAASAYLKEKRVGTCSGCGGRLANRYGSTMCMACYHAAREAAHGTEARYKRCRCELCREAASAARSRRRHANPEVRLRENRKRMERYYAEKAS